MRCTICKTGKTQRGTASLTVEKNAAFVVFANVDARVCDNCGEAYFDSATAKKLQQKAEEEFKKGLEIELVKL